MRRGHYFCEVVKVVDKKHPNRKDSAKLEETLTPREIVKYLDRYIIGQDQAKKMVAIALRNRFRRKKLDPSLRDEVAPKNILMIGPTGVGKTEIARRLARLVNAPFIKVEATKYTEVGYVGRDVESMIRDLVRIAVAQVKEEVIESLKDEVEKIVEKKIIAALKKPQKRKKHSALFPFEIENYKPPEEEEKNIDDTLIQRYRRGELDDEEVEITVTEKMLPLLDVNTPHGIDPESLGIDIEGLEGIFAPFMPIRKVQKRMKVKDAKRLLFQEEANRRIDMDRITRTALERVQEFGIVFIDEIDKLVSHEHVSGGVSREGVQRDLLPLVEGTTVNTRFGPVRTDHILFIAAGAFHMSKPSDLIPELQGRFPIRVELKKLTKEDFVRILKEPENSLIKQYVALMATEGVTVEFTDEAIEEMAHFAYLVNERSENIGARRLYTVVEKVMEEISFVAPEISGQKITITSEYVRERLKDIVADEDLSRYIL